MEVRWQMEREDEQPLLSKSRAGAAKETRFSLGIASLIKRKCKSLWGRRRGRRSVLGRRICEVGARVRCLFATKRRRSDRRTSNGRQDAAALSGESTAVAMARKLMPIVDPDHAHRPPAPSKGLVPVYVGRHDGHQRRFLVPIPYLNHPLFQGFLKAAEQEFGFEHQGALSIPCDLHDFQQMSLPCRRR